MVRGHFGPRSGSRGCSSMVEPQSSKLITRVRFPSSAPRLTCKNACRAKRIPHYSLKPRIVGVMQPRATAATQRATPEERLEAWLAGKATDEGFRGDEALRYMDALRGSLMAQQ